MTEPDRPVFVADPDLGDPAGHPVGWCSDPTCCPASADPSVWSEGELLWRLENQRGSMEFMRGRIAELEIGSDADPRPTILAVLEAHQLRFDYRGDVAGCMCGMRGISHRAHLADVLAEKLAQR